MKAISSHPEPAVIEAAAHWAVVLEGSDVSAEDRQACEKWCQEHPDHRAALRQLIHLNGAFAPDGDALERVALDRLVKQDGAKRRRNWAASLGAIALVAATSGWLWSMRNTAEQFQTGIGEQRAIALQDGSRLTLDTNGSASAEMAGAARNVILSKGQIFAEVASGQDRPFIVTTPDGTVTALGTAFVVRRQAHDTLVTVVESHVRICPAAHGTNMCRTLGPGQRARFDASAVIPLADTDPHGAKLWTTGWIEADDRPVATLLDELNRYRATPVIFNAQALSAVRVSGSYPLRDTDYAIQGIARAAGLHIEQTPDGAMLIRR